MGWTPTGQTPCGAALMEGCLTVRVALGLGGSQGQAVLTPGRPLIRERVPDWVRLPAYPAD
jgi:hypothetical protein